jgi:TonB family protein
MTPLPHVTSLATAFGVKLVAVFRVLPDGSTRDVTLLRSSGDVEWDRPAIDSMKQWRFIPITGDAPREDRLIRLAVVVQVQDPVVLQLAEIVLPSKGIADSLYALLNQGTDFETLGGRLLPDGTTGTWKPRTSANIVRFPAYVREVLCQLRSNQVSEPIRIGLDYVMFKKYKPDN